MVKLQQEYLKRDPPLTRPADIAVLLDHLETVTDEATLIALNKALTFSLPPDAANQISEAVNRWRFMLNYYIEQVAQVSPNDRAAIEQTVTDPLLRGYCWGPPSCTLTPKGGEPLAIAPRAAEPFIILRMIEAAEEADIQNRFIDAASESAEELWEQAKTAAGEAGKAIGALIGPIADPLWKPLTAAAGVLLGTAAVMYVWGQRG